MAQRLASIADAEAMLADSQRQPVLLFKHSSTCPVSFAARAEFDAFDALDSSPPCYVVVVQTDRAVSAFLADALDVRHESPQAVLIDAGTAVFAASHGRIRTATLAGAIRAHAAP
ncbi:MAG TPA: bacillithiol system redox-active protein YtxJ [Rubricoccaceae bacterium]|jgi:bacillithiol system protein YtxJ